MADQAVLKYLSIDTTFDPCYLSLDSIFKYGTTWMHRYGTVGAGPQKVFLHYDRFWEMEEATATLIHFGTKKVDLVHIGLFRDYQIFWTRPKLHCRTPYY